jgi:hypothetical protein
MLFCSSPEETDHLIISEKVLFSFFALFAALFSIKVFSGFFFSCFLLSLPLLMITAPYDLGLIGLKGKQRIAHRLRRFRPHCIQAHLALQRRHRMTAARVGNRVSLIAGKIQRVAVNQRLPGNR